MKQKKLANILVTLGFLGFLALMLVVTLVRPKESWSYYENRNLARPAELTLENLWNGTYPNSVESVLQDHAAGRNTMLKLSTWLDLEVFHRPVVNEIVPTQDKLLGYLAYETVDPQYIHDRAQEIGDIQAQLRDVVESCGGSYYYVALPGQYHYFADQYPDYLNSGADKASLTLKEFTAAMEERGVNLIDGGIAMDDGAKAVTVDGESVSLTPIEYNILLLLMRHPGRVFSTSQIYERVWNDPSLGSENTVAVHIRHLREKLEIDPADPRYIKVVWGLGYKMEKQ